jgi:hypothetical protein
LFQFLGVTEAEHPKGIEVVKDSIRKLKLDEEIRRAEGGKTPKVKNPCFSWLCLFKFVDAYAYTYAATKYLCRKRVHSRRPHLFL